MAAVIDIAEGQMVDIFAVDKKGRPAKVDVRTPPVFTSDNPSVELSTDPDRLSRHGKATGGSVAYAIPVDGFVMEETDAPINLSMEADVDIGEGKKMQTLTAQLRVLGSVEASGMGSGTAVPKD